MGMADSINSFGDPSMTAPASGGGGGFGGQMMDWMGQMADVQNPMLKDTTLPPILKLLMSSKFGVQSGNSSFAFNGTPGTDAKMMKLVEDLIRKQGVTQMNSKMKRLFDERLVRDETNKPSVKNTER